MNENDLCITSEMCWRKLKCQYTCHQIYHLANRLCAVKEISLSRTDYTLQTNARLFLSLFKYGFFCFFWKIYSPINKDWNVADIVAQHGGDRSPLGLETKHFNALQRAKAPAQFTNTISEDGTHTKKTPPKNTL